LVGNSGKGGSSFFGVEKRGVEMVYFEATIVSAVMVQSKETMYYGREVRNESLASLTLFVRNS